MFQQAVGEATCGSTHVDGVESPNIDSELLQGSLQFEPAPADIAWGGCGPAQRGALAHQGGRLRQRYAGHDHPPSRIAGGGAPRADQPAPDHLDVQSPHHSRGCWGSRPESAHQVRRAPGEPAERQCPPSGPRGTRRARRPDPLHGSRPTLLRRARRTLWSCRWVVCPPPPDGWASREPGSCSSLLRVGPGLLSHARPGVLAAVTAPSVRSRTLLGWAAHAGRRKRP